MELKISRDWFEKRAAKEGDLEIGAGGPQDGPRPVLSAANPIRAVLVAVAVAPAVAGMQVIMLLALIAVMVGMRPPIETLAALMPALPVAILVSYMIGVLPAAVGALLMYPVVRARLPAILEYLAAAIIGAVMAGVAVGGMDHLDIFDLNGGSLLGILPALLALLVYRRMARRPSGSGRPSASWTRRQPL
jgi:hypothetical protein